MDLKLFKKADYVIIILFLILLVFGLVMLSSASTAVGKASFDNSYFFIKKQVLLGVLPGMLLFFLFSQLDYHLLLKASWLFFVFSLLFLFLVFVPGIGSTLNTFAHSWLVINGFTFQPAEFTKLALIIFLAAYLAKKENEIQIFKTGFLPVCLLGLIPIFLIILQPDFGTVCILLVILISLLFFGGSKISHILLLFLVGVFAFSMLFFISPESTKRLTNRFTVFLRPELDPQGIGYQTSQALVAVGSGGIWGLGLGHSRQKFQYLPEVQADSIFAIIAEEMGFFVCLGLIILLAAIGLRGFKIAKKAPDTFGKLLVGGILVWFIFQSLLNVSTIIGLFPLTGVPFPFVSHGGTALMAAIGSVGIIVNVSKQTT